MNVLLYNLLLALIWVFGTGAFTLGNLLFGFAIGLMVLALAERAAGRGRYFFKFLRLVDLTLFFCWELLLANLRVAHDALTPGLRLRPGIVAVPLSLTSDTQIAVLSLMVTLTPGSLVLDVSSDRKVIYVHSMYIGDVERFITEIKNGYERRVRELME